jgi:catechol 2,3-dioxygenase-like lactoylglutathione lyase family enzyme
MAERRVVIDHLTIGVRDLERSRAFYRAALAPLGFEERGPWSDEQREIAFGAEGVDDFAISPQYEPGYYGAFALDPDGHNVEAVFHGGG